MKNKKSDDRPEEPFLEPEVPETPANIQFAEIFEEMVDVLQFAVDNTVENIKGMPEDIEARLAQLEYDVDLFCRLNTSIVGKPLDKKSSNVNPPGLLALPKRQKAAYERSVDLSKKLEKRIDALKKRLKEIADSGSIMQTPATKEERKKSFKQYGIRDKWRRL